MGRSTEKELNEGPGGNNSFQETRQRNQIDCLGRCEVELATHDLCIIDYLTIEHDVNNAAKVCRQCGLRADVGKIQ